MQMGSESGIALFVVLWVLTLLMVIVGQFSFTVRHELQSLRNFKEATEAYYIAEAGLNSTLLDLVKGREIGGQLVEDPDEYIDEDEELDEAYPEAQPSLRINAPNPPVPFANGRFAVWIDNASGRFNLNSADDDLLRLMLDPLVADEDTISEIVDAIMDWRDSDDLHRLNGAESDYYRSLDEPYACKNGDFDTVDELLFVKGVTPEIFYGGLRDMVTVSGSDAGDGQRLRRIFRGRTAAATSRININAAPRSVLMALPEMTEDRIEAIETYRSEQDFKSLAEVADVVGADAYDAISPYISLELSNFYTIYAEGMLIDSPVRQRIALRLRIDPMLPDQFEVLQRIEG